MNKVIQDDCLNALWDIPDKSVDMIFADLPYAETGNDWDKSIIPTKELFQQLERVIKDDGAIVMTATMKFAVELIASAPHLYKYDWVWEKDNGTNAPNVNLQPFRVHEFVLVFGKGRVSHGIKTPMKYNPQKTKGEPYKQMSGKQSENWKGGLKNVVTDNSTGDRHPKTIQKINRDSDKLHPTQKPVSLLEYLIKTYTNEGDTVLDPTAGSGTTGVACKNLNRNYILIEKEPKYIEIINKRLTQPPTK